MIRQTVALCPARECEGLASVTGGGYGNILIGVSVGEDITVHVERPAHIEVVPLTEETLEEL